jgi:hypothetical protein
MYGRIYQQRCKPSNVATKYNLHAWYVPRSFDRVHLSFPCELRPQRRCAEGGSLVRRGLWFYFRPPLHQLGLCVLRSLRNWKKKNCFCAAGLQNATEIDMFHIIARNDLLSGRYRQFQIFLSGPSRVSSPCMSYYNTVFFRVLSS